MNAKSIGFLLLAALAAETSFGQPSVEPAVPDKPWTHNMWLPRFDAKRELAATGRYDIVFLGDSITHGWESAGKEVWKANFSSGPYRALNCGISGDRTEHILWRLDHNQLAGHSPKIFVLMIGTNNTGHHDIVEESPLDTILGIQSVLGRLTRDHPESKIVLHPIFPRGATTNDPNRVRNDVVNSVICKFADGKRTLWCDFNSRFLTADGVLEKSMAKDLLHPGAAGYAIWAESLKPYLDFALGRTKRRPEPPAPPAPTALPKSGPRTTLPDVKMYWLANIKQKVEPRLRNKRAEVCANSEHYYDAIWLGDSITHFLERTKFNDVRKEKFNGYRILNLGFGGDKTQNLLWNIEYGGFLDCVHTRLVTIMIGTNNVLEDTPEDIANGIRACLAAVRRKQPQAKVLLFSILPRDVAHGRGKRDCRRTNRNVDEIMPKILKINELIRPLADGEKVVLIDLVAKFTDAEGLPDINLLPDGTHPDADGYRLCADTILPYLKSSAKRPLAK